jgi:cytoskeletal protein RodZ
MFVCDKLMMTDHNADSNLIDLKTARENSGLTLKNLFERTRISVVNLEAIENSNFHLLPIPICTRNFIKAYADALGVDSKPVLQRYENYLQTLQMKEKEQPTEQRPHAPLVTVLVRHKAYLWILCTIIVFAAIAFFVSIYNKPVPEAPQKTEAPKEAMIPATDVQNLAQPDKFSISINLPIPEKLITANQAGDGKKQTAQKLTEAQAGSTPASAVTPKNNKPKVEALIHGEKQFVLIIHATEKTWIRIQVDDKEPFQVLLDAGERISHKAARFNMDIGNAGGVKIQFDGKTIENIGKSGQVTHLRLP